MNPSENAEGVPIGDGLFATEVERPSSVAELQEAVRRHVAAGHSLYPQGGGTALDFGGIPREPGVAVSTKGLARVIDYPVADMTITVEAGITLGELSAILDREGQRLTIEAPRAGAATLGGIYATNTCGPRRFGVGRPRDQILGVSFVTSDGEVIKGGGRVVKNVAGYDFPRLLTGSMGTLGILSQMTLKVRPKPEASALMWINLPTVEALGRSLELFNQSETRPIAIEALNELGAEAVAREIGLPASSWALAIGFEDNAASVAWQLERLRIEMQENQCQVVEGEAAARLWASLVESPDAIPATLAIEAHVPASKVALMAAEIGPEDWAIQAHAGTGIIRAYHRGEIELIGAIETIGKLRAVAEGFGGSLTLPRCPTDWKNTLRVWGNPRPDWTWCERLKQTLDPAGALNPGRFVGTI